MGYWDNYYSAEGVPELPSQFALFVANEIATGEIPTPAAILDIGCGNGRDTVFFARLGYVIGAIDQSEAAVAACRDRLRREHNPALGMAELRVGHANSADLNELADRLDGPLLIYSRFFFHAIDEAAEASVIERAGAVLGRRGGALAVEFRTTQDATATKVTSDHYRRFIEPDNFASLISAAGLTVKWRAEGRGMAKYRGDDAYVARLVATP